MAWTDYPFAELGDEPGKPAPIRQVELVAYDGNKYVALKVAGIEAKVKSGYLYASPRRFDEHMNDWPRIKAVLAAHNASVD